MGDEGFRVWIGGVAVVGGIPFSKLQTIPYYSDRHSLSDVLFRIVHAA